MRYDDTLQINPNPERCNGRFGENTDQYSEEQLGKKLANTVNLIAYAKITEVSQLGGSIPLYMISDILCDLMHLAAHSNLNLTDALDHAKGHFAVEAGIDFDELEKPKAA